MSLKSKANYMPYVFMLPAILFILFAFIVPFFYSIVISLTSWNGIDRNITFIGFENYISMFSERSLPTISYNNLRYFLVLVFVQNAIAIALAVLLNKSILGRNLFRSIIFVPTMISAVAVAFTWSIMYSPLNGILPTIINTLNIPYLNDSLWLADQNISIYLIMITSMWQWAGWSMVIYLAGLKSIPNELYESASIDGANALKCFWHITFPLLAPAITISIITSSIGAIRIFDLPFIMTGGGPGFATESLAITIYRNAFKYFNMGYSTALSFVMFLFITAIAIIQLVYLRKREESIQ